MNDPTTPAPAPAITAAPVAGRHGRGWAYAGLIFGSGGSVAANVGHAFVRPTHAPADWRIQPGAIAWGVAVAVALLISVEVLARVEWPSTPGWRTVRYAGGSTVALVAAATSYRHLSDLLAHWGETTPVIYGGPAIVDGLMILCSFALMIPTTPTALIPAAVPDPVAVDLIRLPDRHLTPDPVTPDPVTADPVAPDPVAPDPVAPDPVAPDSIPPSPERPKREDRIDHPTPRAQPRSSPTRSVARAAGSAAARPEDLARARAAIAAGQIPPHPSATAIRALLSISPAYARATRDALTNTGHTPPEPVTAKPSPYAKPEHEDHENPAEETSKEPKQQPIPASRTELKTSTQRITDKNQLEKAEEVHTNATLLT